MPRGGKRPGAGAPKHNFNAVKHGRYSPKLRLIAGLLLQNSILRAAYKSLRAALARQALSLAPAAPAGPVPRCWLAIIADGKLTRYYLGPKNKKIQSNILIILNSKNALPSETIIKRAKTGQFRAGPANLVARSSPGCKAAQLGKSGF